MICCSFLGVMPAYCYSSNCLGTKVRTLYTDNERKDAPNIQAIVVQMDPSTGSVIAVRIKIYFTSFFTPLKMLFTPFFTPFKMLFSHLFKV